MRGFLLTLVLLASTVLVISFTASPAEATGPRFRRQNVVVVNGGGHHVSRGNTVVVQSRGFFGVRRNTVIVNGR